MMMMTENKMMTIIDHKDGMDDDDYNNNENEGYVLVDSPPPPHAITTVQIQATNTGSSSEDIIIKARRRRKDWKKRMIQQRKELPPPRTTTKFLTFPPKIINKKPRAFFCGILQILWSICRSWITWQLLVLLLNTTTPIVVITSGSLIGPPQRNDVLILNNWTQEFQVGDITTFEIKDRHTTPITHRILKKVYINNNTIHYLTKGDDNRVDDRGLYAPGQLWLHRDDFLGKVIIRIPHIGFLSILLADYPVIFYIWILKLALSILLLAGNNGYYYNTSANNRQQAVKRNSWKLSILIFAFMLIQGW